MTIPDSAKFNTRYRKNTIGGYEAVRFKRPEVASVFYESRHAIDDNNNVRQGRSSIEGSWGTHQWYLRTFAFIMGICEANAFSIYRYFNRDDDNKLSHFDFRVAICDAILNGGVPVAAPTVSHKLQTYSNTEIYKKGKWKSRSRSRSIRHQFRKVCRTCTIYRKICTYCECSPQNGMCRDCWRDHVHQLSLN